MVSTEMAPEEPQPSLPKLFLCVLCHPLLGIRMSMKVECARITFIFLRIPQEFLTWQ